MFNQIKILILLILINVSTTNSQSITLESVVGSQSGIITNDSLPQYELITFNLRLTNDATPNLGITNGFSFSSPNGANWKSLVADTLVGFKSKFDLIYEINTFSTGSGADTVGFGGAALYQSGLEAYFDEVAYAITIGPFNGYANTVILDTAFYRPTGAWKWAGPDQTPSWDGPHIFSVYINEDEARLSVSPDSFYFPMISGQTEIITDSIYGYTSTMFGAKGYELEENIPWLTLESTSRENYGYINFTVSNPELGDSVYVDSIKVIYLYAGNSPQYVKVILDVRFTQGDFNLDNDINMEDIIAIVEYFFLGGPPPMSFELIDMDNNNIIDISDLIELIRVVYF